MNIRQLVDWGLVTRVHKLGDRKEYFAAETDVWEMFQTIMRERRRREVEPIIETIDRCREMAANQLGELSEERRREAAVYRQRLDNMSEFLNAVMQYEAYQESGALPYERGPQRKAHRNCTRPRTLKTVLAK